jgi:oligosaccharide reducing-end xylanase
MRPALRSILVMTAAAALLPLCAFTQVVKLPAPPLAGYAPPAPHKNAPQGEIPRMPGDGDGAYKTNHYRDLFAEAGYTPAESSAKIEKTFQQLFHGDGQYERLYFETGANPNGPLAYMTDWANNDARTEGMSYGMMIAVQLNKKREFDALWNRANTYMLVTDPKNPTVGYFAWSMATDNSPRSTGPAPDGEEYFVMSLYFAAHRWGNGKGIYNYQAEADKILRGMRHHPVLTGTTPFRIHPDDPPFIPNGKPWPSPNNDARLKEMAARGITPSTPTSAQLERMRAPRTVVAGPMVEEAHTMIRFVPEGDGTSEGFTDASYHLPAFYELWSRWGPPEDRAFWAKAADVSRQLFFTITGPSTGLTPERSNFDMTPMVDRNANPAPTFGYDSWRSVSNWSVDYSCGKRTPGKLSSAIACRHSLRPKGSTSSSIGTHSRASPFPSATPQVCWPQQPLAALPPPLAQPQRLSLKPYGIPQSPRENNATMTACSI